MWNIFSCAYLSSVYLVYEVFKVSGPYFDQVFFSVKSSLCLLGNGPLFRCVFWGAGGG